MLCTRADLKKEQETALIVVNYIGIVNLITVVQNELIVIMAVSYQHYMEYVASVLKGMVHNGWRKPSFQCGLRIVRESPTGLSRDGLRQPLERSP
jgi:hypothetical protein